MDKTPRSDPRDDHGYYDLAGVGSIGHLSDAPSRKRKHPIGFAAPSPPKRKPTKKRRRG